MGLSLYWEFVAREGIDSPGVVRALREAALSAGFAVVGNTVEASSEVHVTGDDAVADRAWALAQGLATVHAAGEGGKVRVARVAATRVVAFRATNPGAEDAVFGLAQYQETGWKFSGGCATQGAGKRGGMAGFLKAHRAIVTVLDKARSLGLGVTVKDDGEYWESRDQKRLLDKFEEWEALLASLARRDAGKPCTLAADVKEKIEALRKNQRRLDRSVCEELEG